MHTIFPPSPLERARTCLFDIDHGVRWRNKYGGFTIPSYQRELVWTDAQKKSFIESIALRLPIGVYVYNSVLDAETPSLVLLDGQQRWNAIFEYIDGKFAVFESKYSELNSRDQRLILQTMFPAIVLENATLEQCKDIYQRLAYGGTPHIV